MDKLKSSQSVKDRARDFKQRGVLNLQDFAVGESVLALKLQVVARCDCTADG